MNRFALNTLQASSTSIMDATSVINDLSKLQSAIWQASYGVYQFFWDVDQLRDTVTPIAKYYTLSDIEPLLRRSLAPLSLGVAEALSSSTPATEPLVDQQSSMPATTVCNGHLDYPLASAPAHAGMSIGE